MILRSLVGQQLQTLRGQENVVLSVEGHSALVATSRSPGGQPVPIAWLQAVLDRLGAGEAVSITPAAVGHRSSFLGAVLATLPCVELSKGPPPAARQAGSPFSGEDVRRELEYRLRAFTRLLAMGATGLPPSAVRDVGLYGGASGVWTDTARTRGIGGEDAVTVGLLHTGRHYDDDLSDEALLYHYPSTDRPPGRDAAEIAATKAAARLRLPVFVILQTAGTRSVRKGWVSAWDDEDGLFLIEFTPVPATRQAPPSDDAEGFVLFEDRDEVMRLVRGRRNQQRFKLEVIRRYGGRCAFCDVDVSELVQAAHLVPDGSRGSSDPRNGLPLCSNHHLALDRGLVAIDPRSRQIRIRRGHTAERLGIRRADILQLRAQPAVEALAHRWNRSQPPSRRPRPVCSARERYEARTQGFAAVCRHPPRCGDSATRPCSPRPI